MRKGLFCAVAGLILAMSVSIEPLRAQSASIRLGRFSEELGGIAIDRPECLSQALARYEALFPRVPSVENDSAYVILEDFADYCIKNVDFNLPLSGGSSGVSGEKYRRNLEKNYFVVSEALDGSLYVEADLYALQNRLKPYLTPAAIDFMRMVHDENSEALNTDELEPGQLAGRLRFWDEYLDTYPGSVFWEEAYERRDACLDALIFGTGTHPLFDEGGRLREEYETIYRLLSIEFLDGTETKTRQVVYDFYKLLEKNDYRDCTEVSLFTF